MQTLLDPVLRHNDKTFEEFRLQTSYPNHPLALQMCKLTSMGTLLRIIDNTSHVADTINSMLLELYHQYILTSSNSHVLSILNLIQKRALAGKWKDIRRTQFITQHIFTIQKTVKRLLTRHDQD